MTPGRAKQARLSMWPLVSSSPYNPLGTHSTCHIASAQLLSPRACIQNGQAMFRATPLIHPCQKAVPVLGQAPAKCQAWMIVCITEKCFVHT